ncbi:MULTISPECIES: alpha/beta fold hydrolase [unclassified Pseudonocardia]|uniref:alpha/beta hydrolase n=1 Tax=unclassified Pseudonocardia TaxID=2619320 RepID=UPI00076157F2|nr:MULTISPECIES: alpha/beta fold hydrolase [unclassified Pseudonocardia]
MGHEQDGRRPPGDPGHRRPAGGTGLAGLVLLLALALLAGCAVGPSQRPPVAVRGELLPATPPPAAAGPPGDPNLLPGTEPLRAGPTFTDCTAAVLGEQAASGTPVPAGRALAAGCSRLTVPADRDRPDLGPTRLGLTRVTTPGAPADLPVLVVLGDTGVDGSSGAAATLAARLPDEVLTRYQVIGMDRRGSGEDLLDCAPADARTALLDAGPDRRDERAMTALLERSRSIVQDCYLLLSGTLTSYRADSSADDVESLRGALGLARLNVVGVGDGADAVADWAARHPDAVGRVVLDGPGDPTLDDPVRTETTTGAAEAAFDAFATACLAGADCPLGPDPRATVRGLVDRLSRVALPVGDGDAVTAGATVRAIRSALSQPSRWPELQSALAAADGGDATGLDRILRAGASAPAGPLGRFDAALATSCNDSRVRVTPGEGADLAGQWAGRFPLFGVAAAQELVACGPWPPGGSAAPAAPRTGTLPPVVVLGTAQDPRAPQSGAERTAEQLGDGRVVRWEGAGTGAYPRTPCVTAVVDRALLDGHAPAEPVVCPP